jgi:putative pyruvate formate lyase activating enzyme
MRTTRPELPIGRSPSFAKADAAFATADAALRAMERCELCELRCRANRLAGERGACRLADRTHVFRLYVSYAEELELSPALMIYLGGCNFRCAFCTQAPRCFQTDEGPELTAPETLEQIESLAVGVRWINLVGGEPGLHPHALIELRRSVRTTARWLLNTNGFFTPEGLELLDPLVDLHLLDFKFGCNDCAEKLAGVPGYVEVLKRNLLRIWADSPRRLLVRHLLMPGHERCCLDPVARWVTEHLPGVRFHLMSSYVPNHQALHDPELGRTVPLEVVRRDEKFCRRLNLALVE